MDRQAINIKFVPFTAVEWKKVQSIFRSNNYDDLSQACNILNMWKFRMGSRTPIFVDITELVLSSLMLDIKFSNDDLSCDGFNANSVRLIFASAIIRFVNYVNEICQPDCATLLSIANAVSTLGIPQWIVTVRHDATHGQMPSLTMMRSALVFCRDWLWRYQWSRKFSDAIKEIPKELYEIEQNKRMALIFKRIYDCLSQYHAWRKKGYDSWSKIRGVMDLINMLLYIRFEAKEPNVREVSAEKREHPPFKRILIELEENAEEFIYSFVNMCLSKVLKKFDNLPAYTGKQLDIVPEEEQFYYMPLVFLLKEKNLLQLLLLQITKQIGDSSLSDEARARLAGWADKLIVAFLQNGSPQFETISDQTWKLILKYVVLSPQFYEDEQIEKILNYMKNKISPKTFKRLARLLQINAKLNDTSVTMVDDSFDTSVLTLDDLQNRLVSKNSTFVKDMLTGEEDWSIADVEELGPLGLTIGQTAESLCLEISK